MSDTGPHIKSAPDDTKDKVLAALKDAEEFVEKDGAQAMYMLIRTQGGDWSQFRIQFDVIHELGALDLFKARLLKESEYL